MAKSKRSHSTARRINPDAIRPDKMMTPEQLASSGTEDGHQMAVMQWAATERLNGWRPWRDKLRKLFAVPLGGKRHIVTAMRMKATGSKKGVPDLMLPVARGGFHGLFVELKLPEYKARANGGRSDEQIRWGLDLQEEGYSVIVAYGWQEAVNAIVAYMNR